ncbi:MAG: sigma-70 family RNA polymerase sigma factor [Acidobacteriota bacterium]
MTDDKVEERGCREGDIGRTVEKLQAGIGGQEDWEHLDRCLRSRMMRLAMGTWKLSKENSEELIQIAFLKVYTNIDAFRGESSFSTWLFRIFSNARRSMLGRPAPEPLPEEQSELEIPDPRLEDPVAQLVRKSRDRRLATAVAELPPQQRTCFLLHYRQGLTAGQIAALLGLSVNTVRAHIYQAKRRLKKVLGEED